jgi:hypothetical protein
MAERNHLRCPVCGKLSLAGAFGITDEEEPVFDAQAHPEHRLEWMIQTLGGRGRISWQSHDIGPRTLEALRQCLRSTYLRLCAMAEVDPWPRSEDEADDGET